MILLIGIDEDSVLKYFSKFLIEKRAKVIFLNQKLLGKSCFLNLDTLEILNRKYSYEDFSGVLNRMVSWPTSGGTESKLNELLCYVLNEIAPNVLNKQKHGNSNISKPYQLASLKLEVLKVPKMFIFAKQNNVVRPISKMVYKSLSSIRSVVHEFEEKIMPFTHEPVQFQELVEGTNIRVHVVKDKLFPIAIESKAIDYRYESSDRRKFFETELPFAVREECIAVSKQLNLPFCGIDLIKKEDSYYILEANPSPAYSFFENKISYNKISQALFNALGSCSL